jgi:hypothetical protein
LATWESDPAATCLSGRPLHRLGSGQQRKVEVPTPAAWRPPRAFKARSRAGGTPSVEESRELESQRSRARPLSKRHPPPGRFTLHGGGRRTRIPAPSGARPLSRRSQPARPVHPPWRRAGDSNATAGTAQSLAAMPGPWPVHSPYRTADSNREPPESESGAST